ncbi:helix-turn-helix transcriptional regulator [uncultured Streptomyces sp.]|uniref:helix-turn-helix domain-containing protein n=1 Tax=uncultured Streptomyces sp. TaxID=174707 RepID=UPI00261CF938|nr:helix-turn-helix transcriptional regulator [uncultured Streptomyces sp.]
MARAENKETASPMARLVAKVAKRARLRKGLSQEQLGKEIGSAAAISAMETCAQPASDDMLVGLERVLGDEMGVFEEARAYIRLEAYPERYKEYALLEGKALMLQLYVAKVIHGLFQTEAYARALMSGAFPPASAQRVEELVQARMARKALFNREPTPLVDVILDEATLRRVVGSEAIMAEQLRHLAECGRRRNITVQVLPLQAGLDGEYPATYGDISVMETPDFEYVGYMETHDESLLIREPARVSTYMQRFSKIRAQALGPRESLDFIAQLVGASE